MPLNQVAKKLFILKHSFLSFHDKAFEYNKSFTYLSSLSSNLNDLDETVNKLLSDSADFSIDEDQTEIFKKSLKKFIEYMKELFFMKTENLVHDNVKFEKYQKNNVDILIHNDNFPCFLYKIDNDVINIFQLLLRYFSKNSIEIKSKEINLAQILRLFASNLNKLFIPIIKKFDEVDSSNMKNSDEFNDSIRKFLLLFYEKKLKKNSKFKCKIIIKQSMN